MYQSRLGGGIDPARGQAVSGHASTLVVWDVDSGEELPLQETEHWVSRLAVGSASGRIVAGSRDGAVRLWDLVSGVRVDSVIGASPVRDVPWGETGGHFWVVTGEACGAVTAYIVSSNSTADCVQDHQ